jgi:hypothetical protein
MSLIRKSLHISITTYCLILSGVAAAADPYWVALSSDVSIDRASIANAGEGDQSAWIQRNYEKRITLGTDAVTGKEVYPHRSVQVQYVVNCAQNTINMVSWKMFAKPDSKGVLVWAGKTNDLAYRYRPMSVEEKSVAGNLCAAKVGSR